MHLSQRSRAPAVLAIAAALLSSTVVVGAIQWTQFESAARGYPVMLDASTGRRIGNGTFAQWIEKGRLHVAITYAGAGRRIEERVVLTQRPELVQDSWSFAEWRDQKPVRRFDVDFRSGHAVAQVWTEHGPERQQDTLKLTPGRTFAGFAFTLAVKAVRARLIQGQRVTLQAVGFAPKPRAVDVEISYAGRDRVHMAGRTIDGDRFIVHAKIPALAKLFVHVPDARIWLTAPPAGFLRWEGPLAEPSDPIVRVDLLPGGSSGPATPLGTSGRR